MKIAGFGERLRQERKRLGLSQDALAEKVGIQRLAQLQYENESSQPNIRYLAAIQEAGLDTLYILFDIYDGYKSVLEHRNKNSESNERKAFEILEVNEKMLGHQLTAEKRYEMFNLIRESIFNEEAIHGNMGK